MNSEERTRMKRVIRFALVTSVAVVSLAFTGSAWASYSPSLTVTASNNKPGAATSLLLGHLQSDTDDPTAKDTVYVPLGYGVNLSQAPGTKIGDISGDLILRNVGNAHVELKASESHIVADNPANWTAQAQRCTPGQPNHEAVWLLDIVVAGNPLQVPLFVDHVTTAPENAFAAAKIQLCLLAPADTQNNPSGAQLAFAFFEVNGVFSNPANTSDRIWHALFTPYVAGTPTPNPGATTEGQAVAPGQVSLTMKTKSLKRGRVIVSGRLTVDGQAFAGGLVELYKPGSNNRIGKGRTNGKGNYTVQIKIKKKTRVIGQVLFLGDLPACPAPGLPGVPQGCQTASVSFFAVKVVTARRKK
jgi:hypothetical protein